MNERWYGVESSTGNSIFVKFRGDLTEKREKREKLMQKTASVPVSFMEKGFNATYIPTMLEITACELIMATQESTPDAA